MTLRNNWSPEDDIVAALMAVILVLLIWIVGMYTIEVDAAQPVEPEIEQTVTEEPEPVTKPTMEELVIPAEPVSLDVHDEPYVPEADWMVEEQLAVGIYREGGGNNVCDDCRVRIADVMLNRVADPRFPDTLKAVLTQKGQYGTMHTDGITFPKRAAQPEEFHAVQRSYDIAAEVMGGRHSELYGQGYIYQSEFPDLGHDAFEHCGIYFAKG